MRQVPQNKGVFHLPQAEQHYRLRRLPPAEKLATVIEQFWWVSWDLAGAQHLQQNLPDPCVNLVFSPANVTLYGPVSRSFSYRLMEKGSLFGVKFTPAGYQGIATDSAAQRVDVVRVLDRWLGHSTQGLIPDIGNARDFQRAAHTIEDLLATVPGTAGDKGAAASNQLVAQIRADTDLQRVEQLAERSAMSVRQCQRLFARYIGLSPKWVIRHYRLQEVIARLNRGEADWQGAIAGLGYSDQSHFIKEFKAMTGRLPGDYLAAAEAEH